MIKRVNTFSEGVTEEGMNLLVQRIIAAVGGLTDADCETMEVEYYLSDEHGRRLKTPDFCVTFCKIGNITGDEHTLSVDLSEMDDEKVLFVVREELLSNIARAGAYTYDLEGIDKVASMLNAAITCIRAARVKEWLWDDVEQHPTAPPPGRM